MHNKAIVLSILSALLLVISTNFAIAGDQFFLSEDDMQNLEDIKVYVTTPRKRVARIYTNSKGFPKPSKPMGGIGYLLDAAGLSYFQFPPQQGFAHDVGSGMLFTGLNSDISKADLQNTINNNIGDSFLKDSWFKKIDVSYSTAYINKKDIGARVKKIALRKNKIIPDGVMVVENDMFFYGHDYYRLWFWTSIQIYDIGLKKFSEKRKIKNKKRPAKLIHEEIYATHYDIRNAIKSKFPGKEISKDLALELWEGDSGKFYISKIDDMSKRVASMISVNFISQAPFKKSFDTSDEVIGLYDFIKIKRDLKKKKVEEIKKKKKNVKTKKRRPVKKKGQLDIKEMNKYQRNAHELRNHYVITSDVKTVNKSDDATVFYNKNQNSYVEILDSDPKFILIKGGDIQEISDIEKNGFSFP